MGSYHDSCEIVELKEDFNSVQPSHGFHQIGSVSGVDDKNRKPVLNLGYPLEDDLNKIFAAINLKSSFEGLSPRCHFNAGLSRKTPKQPLKPDSLGIESPEPATLKQALRGLCVSQASEIAAMKRLSKSNSSYLGVSDAARRTNSYRPVVNGQIEDGILLGKGKVGIAENSHSSSNLSEKIPRHLKVPKIRLSTQNVTSPHSMASPHSISSPCSTPSLHAMSSPLSTSKSLTYNAMRQTSQTRLAEKGKITSVHSPNCSTITTDIILDTDLSSKALGSKHPPVGRSQNSSSSSRLIDSDKLTHRLGKPVLKDKSIIAKKIKQDPDFMPVTSSTGHNEIDCRLDPSNSQLVCQRCNCALKKSKGESNQTSPVVNSRSPADTINPCSASNNGNGESAMNAKTVEKVKFSQSSKSSLGENSTSTSISEESNPSRPSCGSRPHMSKDVRWKAIRRARMKHGVLGLEHFNLVRKLGCGDIGTVYLAELVDSNCLFAIKVMDNEYLERRKKLPRAQTEREILKILDHPFLPTLYVHFTSDDLSCLVMEYCPGGDLHVLRQRQPGRNFPEQVARFYAAEVLLALEYLHMLGVVYRDLKPENILVRGDGHIMLTDFDLSLRCTVNPTLVKSSSKTPPTPCAASSCIDPFCIEPSFQSSCFLPRKTNPKKSDLLLRRSAPQLVAEPTSARSNSFVGTHEYLAPEIIKGEGHGSAVDWWTFGIFLYELLYGRTPFKGCGNEETLGNVVLQGLRFPSGGGGPLVSCDARDLIRGLLAKEPERRLGWERGASEIKRHPFFEGLNWALIRCAVPPGVPCEGKKRGFVDFEMF